MEEWREVKVMLSKTMFVAKVAFELPWGRLAGKPWGSEAGCFFYSLLTMATISPLKNDQHHDMRHHDRHSDVHHHDHDNDDQHILHFQTFSGDKCCLLLHGWLDNAGTWDKVAVLINLINIIILITLTLADLALLDITLKVT